MVFFLYLFSSNFVGGHEDWVTGIDGSSDANWVLTSSKDATIRLWNLENAVMEVEKPQLV